MHICKFKVSLYLVRKFSTQYNMSRQKRRYLSCMCTYYNSILALPSMPAPFHPFLLVFLAVSFGIKEGKRLTS